MKMWVRQSKMIEKLDNIKSQGIDFNTATSSTPAKTHKPSVVIDETGTEDGNFEEETPQPTAMHQIPSFENPPPPPPQTQIVTTPNLPLPLHVPPFPSSFPAPFPSNLQRMFAPSSQLFSPPQVNSTTLMEPLQPSPDHHSLLNPIAINELWCASSSVKNFATKIMKKIIPIDILKEELEG